MPARLQELYRDRENMEFRLDDPMDIMAVPPIDPSQIRAGEIAVPISMVFGHLRSRSFIKGQSGWEIDYSGNAEFNNVTIRGTVISQSGEIAGFIIDENTISKDDILIDSSGKIVLGSGDDSIRMSSVDTTYRLWIGDEVPASAPFSVTKEGIVNIFAGSIAGWSAQGNKLSSGNIEFDSDNSRILIKKNGQNKIVIEG